jgi:hypothetical protein
MQGVEGQWNGQVVIGGREVPLHPKSLLNLNIFNSIHQQLPSMQLAFKDDGAQFVGRLGVKDGDKIEVILGDGGSTDSPTMIFNVQGDVKIKGTHSAEQVELSAVLDHVEWLRKIVTGATKGPSTAAIAKVAGMAGLNFESHGTSDAMTWLPNNKPLASYARHVMERGWASATSCMLMGVSDDASLRYFDLDQIIGGGVSQNFGLNGIPVLQALVASKSDLYNNITGYGSTSTNFDAEGIFKELNKVGMRLLSSNVAAGLNNVSSIGALGGRIMSRALDIGNVHKKFFDAMHQNQRIRAQFSHDVHVLVDRVSGVKLLDLAGLELASKADGATMASQTGSYVVSGFVRLLAGNRYLEKVTLTSQSTN